MPKNYLCDARALTKFCTDIFAGFGFGRADAEAIANQLVIADMRGMASHGVVRTDMYLTHARKGAIDPAAVPEIVRETPVTAVIDGHKAAGAVVSELAVKLAREKAEASGIAVVVARNSNHHGTCGYWGTKIAQDDMLAFVTSNTPPFLAAPVSKGPVIGNNPISVVVPANGRDMCLDISNGVMAFGKIHEYRRLNKPFPANACLDREGNPTVDPFANEFLEFISLPVGMHKGFGLAVMAEAVTSMLSGGEVAAEIAPPGADLEENNPTCHCFVAIKLAGFLEPAAYRAKVDRFIDYLHEAAVQKEGDYVYYPGEIENIAYEQSLKQGVPLPENIKELLCKKAEEAGLSIPEGVFGKALDV